jgi:UDP-N-acetyl-2-amino-2-deoxyglucuronate dehydrogenase
LHTPKIKFAILGCGRIAQRHAEHISTYGELVAVCDIVAAKADALALLWQAKAYYNLEDMLQQQAGVEVVAVCTPNGLHAAHTIQALRAGRHVLCEKPMAINSADCQAMIDASLAADRNLFVVKQNRFNPPVQAVKKLLDEGRLGQIYSVQLNCFWNRDALYYKDSWKGTLQLDGGTLFTQFSHFIDLLNWMLGDVQQVKAITRNYAHRGIIEFEDTGAVILEFKSGVIGTLNYTVNSHRKNMEGSLTLFGEKGTVKIGGEYLNRIDYQDIKGYVIKDLPGGNTANEYGGYQGSMSNHDKVYENLVRFLQTGEPVYISSREGMKSVEIIEGIYTSARQFAGQAAPLEG